MLAGIHNCGTLRVEGGSRGGRTPARWRVDVAEEKVRAPGPAVGRGAGLGRQINLLNRVFGDSTKKKVGRHPRSRG